MTSRKGGRVVDLVLLAACCSAVVAAETDTASNCTSPFVWYDDRQQCVCPTDHGYELVGDKCVKQCEGDLVRNADGDCVAADDADSTRCTSPYVWYDDKQQCICPRERGYELVGDKCVKQCEGDLVRNADGNCVAAEDADIPECPANAERDERSGVCKCLEGFEPYGGTGCLPLCPSNAQRDSRTGICRCNPEYEWSGSRCLGKCPAMALRLRNSNTCACVRGFVMNTTSNSCDPKCPSNSHWESSRRSCTCKTGYVRTLRGCQPANKCPTGARFDFSKGRCVCSEGLLMNSVGRCEAPSQPTCPKNSTWLREDRMCTCLPTHWLPQDSQSCQEIPTCPSGAFFDVAMGKCRCKRGVLQEDRCVIPSEDDGLVCPEHEELTDSQLRNRGCKCVEGYERDASDGLCRPIKRQCPSFSEWSFRAQRCVCTVGAKRLHGVCTPVCSGNGEVFSWRRKSCVCATGRFRNSTTGQCERSCTSPLKWDASRGGCDCGPRRRRVADRSVCECHPYFDTFRSFCLAPCPQGTLRDDRSGRCICIDSDHDVLSDGRCVAPCSTNEARIEDLVRSGAIANVSLTDIDPNSCVCRPGFRRDRTSTCVRVCEGVNEVVIEGSDSCECADGYERSSENRRCVPICGDGAVRNERTSNCECPVGTEAVGRHGCLPVCDAEDGLVRSSVTGKCRCQVAGYVLVNDRRCVRAAVEEAEPPTPRERFVRFFIRMVDVQMNISTLLENVWPQVRLELLETIELPEQIRLVLQGALAAESSNVTQVAGTADRRLRHGRALIGSAQQETAIDIAFIASDGDGDEIRTAASTTNSSLETVAAEVDSWLQTSLVGAVGHGLGETVAFDVNVASQTENVGSCFNGVLDGTETDIDCGGTACGACDRASFCHSDSDCSGSLNCLQQVCQQAPSVQLSPEEADSSTESEAAFPIPAVIAAVAAFGVVVAATVIYRSRRRRRRRGLNSTGTADDGSAFVVSPLRRNAE